MSTTNAASEPGPLDSSSKSSFGQCTSCPHRLSELWKHEINLELEPEPEPNTDTKAAPPNIRKSSNISEKEKNPADTVAESKPPPTNGTETRSACHDTASMPAEHLQTEHAKAWIDMKEGQDHLKICVASCPYRVKKVQDELAFEADEAKKEMVGGGDAKKLLEDHLETCVANCPYRPKTSQPSITHISIVEAGPAAEGEPRESEETGSEDVDWVESNA